MAPEIAGHDAPAVYEFSTTLTKLLLAVIQQY